VENWRPLNVAGVSHLDGLPPDSGGSRVFGARVCVWASLQVLVIVNFGRFFDNFVASYYIWYI